MAGKTQSQTMKAEIQADPGVKELADKMERLETAALQRRKNAQKMQDTITQKRQEAQEAQSKAQKAMTAGKDPLPHAKRAAELETEIKHLESLLPAEPTADSAAEELAKIRETTPALKGRVKTAISKSTAAADIAEVVRKKLNEVKGLIESYDAEVSEILTGYSLKEELVDLPIEDENLNLWIIRRLPHMALFNPPHPTAKLKKEPAKQQPAAEADKEDKISEPETWSIDMGAAEREKRPPQAKRNKAEI